MSDNIKEKDNNLEVVLEERETQEKNISLDEIENAPEDLEELFSEPPTLELDFDEEPTEDELKLEEMDVDKLS